VLNEVKAKLGNVALTDDTDASKNEQEDAFDSLC